MNLLFLLFSILGAASLGMRIETEGDTKSNDGSSGQQEDDNTPKGGRVHGNDTSSVAGQYSLNPDDYENAIVGKTFTSTLKIDEGDSNTLILDCKFVGIDGNAIDVRNVSNVVIADNTFEDISGTGIRFRSSGSTDDCAVISNDFRDIGLNAISSAKRSEIDVDHKGLVVHGNVIGDTGFNGNNTAHAIYVQSSGAQVSGNTIIGEVDANAISIRGDGIVVDNYIDVTTSDKYGSGIKYYSDHQTGSSKELVIENNYIDGNGSLYSGVELKIATAAIPDGVSIGDWVVNDFTIADNTVSNVSNDLEIDNLINNASWISITFENPEQSSTEAGAVQLSDIVPITDDPGLPEAYLDNEEIQDLSLFL